MKNINDLKEQISLKELEIKNIRAAKSEFSYHFAQSLLKTINTLNMEVIDLNKNELDDEFKFAGKLDPNVLEKIYQQYLREVENIKEYDVRVVRKETRSVFG